MEVNDQDKEMGMPSSFSYRNQLNNDSYSSAPKNSAVGERRRDETPHGDPNPPQTLIFNPGRDPDPDLEATTAADTRSNLLSPPHQPQTSHLQPAAGPTSATIGFTPLIRYRECLKNHAANMGGHVVDGCGEFMPRGEDDTPEAMKCEACECHRSFHRKEINGESQYAPSSYYCNPNGNNTRRNVVRRLGTQQPTPLHHHHRRFTPLLMNFGGGGPAESSSEDINMFHFNGRGQPSHPHSSKKRFRTKFSQEQKDKMMEFADKLGWRIQKQDEEQVHQFCDQVGVKRQVFKVWKHNNKQAMKRKQM